MTEIPHFIRSSYGDMFLIENFDESVTPKTWIIALNSGLQCRTGPQRLYIRMARYLAECGYGVVRVDLPGVGDSEGPTPPTHFDLHDPTNVRDVVRYVRNTHQPEKLVLLGLCAGARVSIKAAMLNPEVDAVILLSMPTFTASPGSERSPEEPRHRISETVARHNANRVKNIFRNRRLLDPAFWRQYRHPKRAYAELVYIVRSIVFLAVRKNALDNLSHFIETLIRVSDGKTRKLFLFGDRDKMICHEFRELNLKLNQGVVITIPDGTHTFSTYSSHRQVILEAAKWLQSTYPVKSSVETAWVEPSTISRIS